MKTKFLPILIECMKAQTDLLIVLGLFTLIEYITALLAVIIKKKFKKNIGLEGIMKRVSIFVLIFLAGIIDCYIIKNGNYIMNGVILYYLTYEGKAILKNISKLGLPIPQILKSAMENTNE